MQGVVVPIADRILCPGFILPIRIERARWFMVKGVGILKNTDHAAVSIFIKDH
jgi:hypothetical protein